MTPDPSTLEDDALHERLAELYPLTQVPGAEQAVTLEYFALRDERARRRAVAIDLDEIRDRGLVCLVGDTRPRG